MTNIDWFSGQPRGAIPDYIAWQDAVKAADNGDSNRLVELLRSPEHWPGPQARIWIADLLARNNLKKKRGGQAMPAYRVSAVEGDLNDAAAHYRYFRRKRCRAKRR